jgi:hypothetical protein
MRSLTCEMCERLCYFGRGFVRLRNHAAMAKPGFACLHIAAYARPYPRRPGLTGPTVHGSAR